MAKPKIRYAVVGQGHFAQAAMPPRVRARQEELGADRARLRRRTQAEEAGQDLRRQRTLGYDGFDDLCASGDIDAIYLAVPNHRHREFAERAAKHGIHVLVEKPMAVTEEDCDAMTAACNNGGAKLMVAYRLHFEESNLRAVDLVRREKLGEPRIFHSAFTMQVAENNVRLNPREEGGGPLYDIGIYCINAARYIFGEEPTEVIGMAGARRRRALHRRRRAARGRAAFSRRSTGELLGQLRRRVDGLVPDLGTKGCCGSIPAYEYRGERRQELTIGDKTKRKKFKGLRSDRARDRLLLGVHHRRQGAGAVGVEGLADVRIIRALYRSIDEGRPVKLEPFEKPKRPEKAQAKKKRPVEAEPRSTRPPRPPARPRAADRAARKFRTRESAPDLRGQ